MADLPTIQHWLVALARSASLEGAEGLDIASDTPAAAAWDVVALACHRTTGELAGFVAAHYRLAVANLAAADPHAHRLLPARLARKLNVLPLRYTDRHLWVATADPVSFEAERDIGHVAARTVHFEVAPPADITEAIDLVYGPEEPPHELPPLETAARGGPRLLVVDDDADSRLLLRTVLEGADFRVVEAETGERALELLAERGDPFALVTLDLNMPGMDGLEVLRRIRSRLATATLPVVVATGADDPHVEMELFEAGADDFVVKPVDPPRFLLRVQAVLRRQDDSFLAGLL